MRIGVDFDDVLYPYHHYLKRRVARRWGVDLAGPKITTFYYELLPALQARGATRDELWHEVQSAWWEAEDHQEAALLDPDAAPILRELGTRHEVVLISARVARALPHIEAFLDRHDIRPASVLLGKEDKSGFDVLVDDFPKHAEQNAEAGGYSILYTIDENSTYDETRRPRILRAHGWRDVAILIRLIEAKRIPDA
jgi:hypothetical protein